MFDFITTDFYTDCHAGYPESTRRATIQIGRHAGLTQSYRGDQQVGSVHQVSGETSSGQLRHGRPRKIQTELAEQDSFVRSRRTKLWGLDDIHKDYTHFKLRDNRPANSIGRPNDALK